MIVKLNVGGKLFEVYYDTIMKIPYFKNMFDACNIPSDTIFVNRSGHVFKYILNWAFDDKYLYPYEYIFELDFYGIDMTNVKIKNEPSELKTYMDNKFRVLENHLNTYIDDKFEMLGNDLDITNEAAVGICMVNDCKDRKYWDGKVRYMYCANHSCNFGTCTNRRLSDSRCCIEHR